MRLYDNLYHVEDYYFFLDLFSEFNSSESECNNLKFRYDFSNPSLKLLRDKYNLTKVAGTENMFRQLVRLMIWVNDQLIGDGLCEPLYPMNALHILEATKNKAIRSNCFMYSVVLNEVYLSMGFYSRMIRCMPSDLRYDDCHCVTIVYVKEYSKWVVFDAANRAYYIDKTMQPMSLMDIRNTLLNREPIYVPMMARKQLRLLYHYWVKNIIRFECYDISCYDAETLNGDRILYHLQPRNFVVTDKAVSFDSFQLMHIHTSNEKRFFESPI